MAQVKDDKLIFKGKYKYINKIKEVKMSEWIYCNTKDNSARFLLGKKGDKVLICIGINPSTAIPNNLDRTLKSVEKAAKNSGYDGWLMLNLYPQRSTDPNGIHKKMEESLHEKNIRKIKSFIQGNQYDVWVAWGTLIEKRDYFKKCLKEIYIVMKNNVKNWYSIGNISKNGHPHHPLYLKDKLPLTLFNMDEYLKHIENVNGVRKRFVLKTATR